MTSGAAGGGGGLNESETEAGMMGYGNVELVLRSSQYRSPSRCNVAPPEIPAPSRSKACAGGGYRTTEPVKLRGQSAHPRSQLELRRARKREGDVWPRAAQRGIGRVQLPAHTAGRVVPSGNIRDALTKFSRGGRMGQHRAREIPSAPFWEGLPEGNPSRPALSNKPGPACGVLLLHQAAIPTAESPLHHTATQTHPHRAHSGRVAGETEDR